MVDPVAQQRNRLALLDGGLYRFLEYYYRDFGVTLLKPWQHDYPLVGWEIPPDRQADLSGLLHFVGPRRHPATPGDFAFQADLSARRQAQHPNLVNNPTFCLRHFDAERFQVVGGLIGNYFDALDTCDVLEDELLQAWAAHAPRPEEYDQFAQHRLPKREALRQYYQARSREKGTNSALSPITCGNGRSAAIAIATLTIFRVKEPPSDKFQAFFAPRSSAVANHPFMLHVAPSGMFQPTRRWTLPREADDCRREWDIRRHVYRELVEEIFNYDEEMVCGLTAQELYDLPDVQHIRGLLEPPGGEKPGAELLVTAVVVNLLNLRPEICTLLLIHDPSWHHRHAHGAGVRPFCYNEEFASARELQEQSLPLLRPIDLWSGGRMFADEEIMQQIGDVSAAHIVAPGAAALWFGFRAAQRRIPQVLAE
jgi:hypothetical protein